jgi:hypothetical protein
MPADEFENPLSPLEVVAAMNLLNNEQTLRLAAMTQGVDDDVEYIRIVSGYLLAELGRERIAQSVREVSEVTGRPPIMTSDHYILVGHDVVPEPDLLKWASSIEDAQSRVVKQDHIAQFLVSTVFLGLDHRLSGKGPPIVFETMVFQKIDDRNQPVSYQTRCATWDEAVVMHDLAVRTFRKQVNN